MSSDVRDRTAEFERHRPYLRAVALRMLGSGNDADAVQEAWMRLSRAGGDGIEDLCAWLTTVTTRSSPPPAPATSQRYSGYWHPTFSCAPSTPRASGS